MDPRRSFDEIFVIILRPFRMQSSSEMYANRVESGITKEKLPICRYDICSKE